MADLSVRLVEPSKAQSLIIRGLLKSLGIEKLEWDPDGETALARMRESKPNLVISAMHLPDMTGTVLVERMRHDERLADIAFLLISSETKYRYLEPIRQAGAIAILPKPCGVEDLKRALNATVDFLSPGAIVAANVDITNMKVLIVDDSGTSRRIIRHVLTNLGMQHFTEARDGMEAIRLLDTQLFDLVVTDYHMPSVDGAELLTFIRENSNQRSIPVLMVTSESDQSRLAAVQQVGVSAICDKPFETDTVRRILERVVATEMGFQ